MKKRGRPPKAEKDKRTQHVILLLTKAEHKALKNAATAQGHPELAGWSRAVLLAAARLINPSDEK